MTVLEFKSKEVMQADKEQRKVFEIEQRKIMLWINQAPKMTDYCTETFTIDFTEQVGALVKLLKGRQIELDALIEALGE